MSVLAKRQHGHTWDNVPTIDGSRWGFLGLMIAIFVLLVVFLIALICCLCRRKSSSKRMNKATKGSNLNTVHPEPTFPQLIKPTPKPSATAPSSSTMVDAGFGKNRMQHNNAAYSTAPQNEPFESYGYDSNNHHQNHGNDMQQYGYGNNQGYPESSHGYHGSNYDQQADEPAFEPVSAPEPATMAGGHHQNSSYSEIPSASKHPNFQAAAFPHQSSSYPQAAAGYPQSSSYSPAPHAQDYNGQQNMDPYSAAHNHEQYGQAYSYLPAQNDAEPLPPAYPAGSVQHNHDLPKSQMRPPGT